MPGMIFNVVKDTKELKANQHNVSIYGDEKVDQSLLESIKLKGLLEPLVIKDDNTIISGHRRWTVLKSLGIDKVQCRVMTFNDDLDEKESLIEFNKQRVKNASQIYNESTTLRSIYSERARVRQIEAAKSKSINSPKVSVNLRQPIDDIETGKTVKKLSESTGVKETKLETILDIGELAETGKILTAKERAVEEHVTIETDKAKIEASNHPGEVKKAESVKTQEVEEIEDEEVSVPVIKKPVDKVTELKKEVAKEVMRKLDNETISINGARQIAKVIQSSPEIAKKAIELLEANPNMVADRAIKEVKQVIKREEIRISEPVKITNGLYNVILCDPPWRYDFAETKNREIENQYPTMTIEEMKALEIPADKDSVMFMWATAPKLKEAIGVLETWGFEYKTCAVWDKELIGMGYWLRGQHELLLIGTKYPLRNNLIQF